MKLLTYTRKQLFGGLIILSTVALGTSLIVQPEPIDSTQSASSFTAYHQNISSGSKNTNYQVASSTTKDDNSVKNTRIDAANTKQALTTVPVQRKSTPVTETTAYTAHTPKPIMPRCNCPMASDSDNINNKCPGSCIPPTPNPLPPPHCAPCGGFRKVESTQVIACPMYCME